MLKLYLNIIFLFFLFLTPSTLYAYIGPGMGGGLIASIFGILISFIVGLGVVIYFPLKRFFKNRKNKNNK